MAKMKKTLFDLQLPDFIRIDWKKPECSCEGYCNCESFKCRLSTRHSEEPVDKAVDTKDDGGVDWSSTLNIDLLNVTWRRANRADLRNILKLVNDNFTCLFDVERDQVKFQIEHCMCFLVAENFRGKVVGAICVDDAPPSNFVMPNSGWESCIPSKYSSYGITCHNTLWIHFMAFTERYRHIVDHRLIIPIFQMFHCVTRMIIFTRPQTILAKFWMCYFDEAKTGSDLEWDLDDDDFKMYCIDRRKYIEKLAIQELNAENKEAIRSVYKALEYDRRVLRKKYGRGYINRIIDDKFRHIYTGIRPKSYEDPSVLVVLTHFDLDVLKEKYELYAFHNFKQNMATDYLMQPEKRYISAISQDMMIEMSEIMNGDDVKRSQETEDKEDAEDKDEKDDEEGEMTVVEGLTWTNFLMAGTQDSDEEEGRGMDKIISTDNPIDKIIYKNLCMTMSSTNMLKDLKSLAGRKTGTGTLSFDAEGTSNAVILDYIHVSNHQTLEDIREFFLLILEEFQAIDYIICKFSRKKCPPEICKYMLRVPPRGYKSWPYYEDEMYTFHKWFLTGVAEVRPINKSDLHSMINVLSMETSSDEILQELFTSAFGKQHGRYTAFALTINKKIVGAAVVCPEREMDFYKFHYDLASIMEESLHNRTEIGYIKHLVINGLHELRTRDFVRRMMRFMNWSSVFFARYPTYHYEQISDFSLPSGLRHFIPVRPRRVPQYVPTLASRVPPYHLLNDYPPFALYHLNLREASMPKTSHHQKIVIVGTGETALSFLENLFFSPYSATDLFTEVVVITKHRSPFAYPRRMKTARTKKSSSTSRNDDIRILWLSNLKDGVDKIKRSWLKEHPPQTYRFSRQQSAFSDHRSSQRSEELNESTYKQFAKIMLPRNGRYGSKYLGKLGLETWVTVVEGTMTGIHRDEKCVEVDKRKIIPYDYLYLFTGKQFCSPQADRRNIALGTECKALYDLRTPYVERVSLKPKNLFTINCLSDATAALRYVKRLSPGKGQILVYGSCPDCLSCIEALMKFGVTPSRIAFIESDLYAPYAIDYFNDPVVYEAIRKKLFEIGISHYFYYNFASWDYHDTTQMISRVHFESQSNMCSLKCLALFSYSPKEISYETLIAYQDSNLVYDDGLVIDVDFSTNDPRIFAAGPGTRYKREYFADHYFHEHYNSSEVGAEVATRALKVILGQVPDENEPVINQSVIDFKRPLVTSCAIPGGLRLFQVRRSGPVVPLEVLINQLDFGSILVTGDVNNGFGTQNNGNGGSGLIEPDYFKIILNDKGFVIDITCISSTPIDEENLAQLYGKHEKLLNNLSHRYKSHLIVDLYEYFKEPWAYLFYHDKFEALMEEFRALVHKKMSNLEDDTFGDLIARALHIACWKTLPNSSKAELEEIFQNHPNLMKKSAEILTQFLNDNADHLPMFMNENFSRTLALNASRDDVYWQYKQRAGEKPLVNDPYTFDMHEDMLRPKKYYEKAE